MTTESHDEWVKFARQTASESEKNWLTAFILSLLLGYLGADRFYLGSPVLGALKLLTLGGSGCWWIIDILLLLFNRMKDDNGGIVRRPF